MGRWGWLLWVGGWELVACGPEAQELWAVVQPELSQDPYVSPEHVARARASLAP